MFLQVNFLLRWTILILAGGACLLAQTITASLRGTVLDAAGASLPNASVTARNTATNLTERSQTRDDGSFLFPSLPLGDYQVTVEAPRFKTLVRDNVVLTVNQAASLNLTMELGQVTETVTVVDTPPLLDTERASLGQVVDNQKIVNLPLNQRNPYGLVTLAPGVTGSPGNQYNDVRFSINGGRQGANDVLLDGIPSAPPLVNPIQGFTIFPSVDAVQEFRVETNNFSAEFGRSCGGIVNLIYKSGSNDLHGSLYDFLRNSVLDSNNYFANRNGIPLASFKRN